MSHDQEELRQRQFDAIEALDALPTHSLSIEEVSYHVIRWHDSYGCMGAVLDLLPRMGYRYWLVVLGEAWTCCDNMRGC
jgi:hypothetical protein